MASTPAATREEEEIVEHEVIDLQTQSEQSFRTLRVAPNIYENVFTESLSSSLQIATYFRPIFYQANAARLDVPHIAQLFLDWFVAALFIGINNIALPSLYSFVDEILPQYLHPQYWNLQFVLFDPRNTSSPVFTSSTFNVYPRTVGGQEYGIRPPFLENISSSPYAFQQIIESLFISNYYAQDEDIIQGIASVQGSGVNNIIRNLTAEDIHNLVNIVQFTWRPPRTVPADLYTEFIVHLNNMFLRNMYVNSEHLEELIRETATARPPRILDD